MSFSLRKSILRSASVYCCLLVATSSTSAAALQTSNDFSNRTAVLNGTSKDSFLDALIANMTVPELG